MNDAVSRIDLIALRFTRWNRSRLGRYVGGFVNLVALLSLSLPANEGTSGWLEAAAFIGLALTRLLLIVIAQRRARSILERYERFRKTGDVERIVRFAQTIIGPPTPENEWIREELDAEVHTLRGEWRAARRILERLASLVVAEDDISRSAHSYFYAQALVGLDRTDEAAVVLRAVIARTDKWAELSREALARLEAQG